MGRRDRLTARRLPLWTALDHFDPLRSTSSHLGENRCKSRLVSTLATRRASKARGAGWLG